MTPTRELLAEHPFLAGLEPTWLHWLAEHGHPVYRNGQHRLFAEGGSARHFWLLRSGRVALDIHAPGRGDVVVETIGPGAELAGARFARTGSRAPEAAPSLAPRGDFVGASLGPGAAGAGAVLGWSWLFPPYRWHFGAVVVEPVRAIEFDAAAVRRLMAGDPGLSAALSQRFMKVVVERLQATRVRLLDLYGYSAGAKP